MEVFFFCKVYGLQTVDTIDTINTIACSSFNWPTDKRWKTFFKTVMGEYGRSDFVLRTYCFTLSFFLISHLSFGPMNWMNEYWNFSCLFVKLYLGLLFFEFSFLFFVCDRKRWKNLFQCRKNDFNQQTVLPWSKYTT